MVFGMNHSCYLNFGNYLVIRSLYSYFIIEPADSDSHNFVNITVFQMKSHFLEECEIMAESLTEKIDDCLLFELSLH